jgi:hypothetical protein
MALVETYQHRGKTWERRPAEARERFIAGVDLGQSSDPTAIAVVHHTHTPLDDWEIRHGKNRSFTIQRAEERFDVRHLERLPLGMSYPGIVEHVGHLLARPPLNRGCDLVIDETGVGRPVGDIFDDAGMKPNRVTITAGGEASRQDARRWHVAKSLLISTLDARLHTGELRFAAELSEAGAMAEELKDFRRKVSAAGRYSYEARVGKHDDLVLAGAIAVWWAVSCQPAVIQTRKLKGF